MTLGEVAVIWKAFKARRVLSGKSHHQFPFFSVWFGDKWPLVLDGCDEPLKEAWERTERGDCGNETLWEGQNAFIQTWVLPSEWKSQCWMRHLTSLSPPPSFLRQSLLLNPELTDLARTVDQWAPGNPSVSVVSGLGLYTPPCLAFCVF